MGFALPTCTTESGHICRWSKTRQVGGGFNRSTQELSDRAGIVAVCIMNIFDELFRTIKRETQIELFFLQQKIYRVPIKLFDFAQDGITR